ncbi:MAG: RNA-binding protein [Chloroherpetonaceae bacterium]|nr:RNA-binding protein [Chloroherpetonaceae bacterium]
MSTKLYVGNLNYKTTEDTLKEVFSQKGEVKSVKIILGKGFGFVEYQSEDEANRAKAELNNFPVDGRPIKVNEARQKEMGSGGPGGGGGGFRRERPSGGGSRREGGNYGDSDRRF